MAAEARCYRAEIGLWRAQESKKFAQQREAPPHLPSLGSELLLRARRDNLIESSSLRLSYLTLRPVLSLDYDESTSGTRRESLLTSSSLLAR